MKEQTDIGRYNPYKAAHLTQASVDPALEDRWQAFKERTKKTSPRVHQQIQRQEAMMAAQRSYLRYHARRSRDYHHA